MNDIGYEPYASPDVDVVEIKVGQLLCASSQDASNQGYDSVDFQW